MITILYYFQKKLFIQLCYVNYITSLIFFLFLTLQVYIIYELKYKNIPKNYQRKLKKKKSRQQYSIITIILFITSKLKI